MNKRLGIYHSRDLDGMCCGAIMKIARPGIHLIGYDYHEPADEILSLAKDYDEVYIADVCLPTMDDMIELSHSSLLIWIDHHKSQIEEFERRREEFKYNMFSFLKVGHAACELAWTYFFESKMPLSVFMLGKYDTWRKDPETHLHLEISWDKTLAFQYGMRLPSRSSVEGVAELVGLEMENGEWVNNSIIKEGEAILEYQKNQSNVYAARSAFDTTISTAEGQFQAVAINSLQNNSMALESVYDPKRHDLMIVFRIEKDVWVVSLYTQKDDLDCSKIAKSMGGGGHQKAAGFTIRTTDDLKTFLNIELL